MTDRPWSEIGPEIIRLVREGLPFWRACELAGTSIATARRRCRLDVGLRRSILLAYKEWMEESKRRPHTRAHRKGRPLKLPSGDGDHGQR